VVSDEHRGARECGGRCAGTRSLRRAWRASRSLPSSYRDPQAASCTRPTNTPKSQRTALHWPRPVEDVSSESAIRVVRARISGTVYLDPSARVVDAMDTFPRAGGEPSNLPGSRLVPRFCSRRGPWCDSSSRRANRRAGRPTRPLRTGRRTIGGRWSSSWSVASSDARGRGMPDPAPPARPTACDATTPPSPAARVSICCE
jgi:hypothetical protein